MPRCYLVKKAKYCGMRDWEASRDHAPNDTTPHKHPQTHVAERAVVDCREELVSGLDGIDSPSFRFRTPEEREIAEDLLELSRSLPPRPKPTFISIFPPSTFFYPPLTPSESPPHPETQDPPPTFTLLISAGSNPPCDTKEGVALIDVTRQATPLTPTTSEYSSDAENICPSAEETLDVGNEEIGSGESRASSGNYSFEDLLVVDGKRRATHRPNRPKKSHLRGRGKRKEPKTSTHHRHLVKSRQKADVVPFLEDEVSELEEGSDEETRRQRFTCSECGKHYATSSNLSRHKQTHRSLDSQNAKRCPTCGKAYVSMPALSMHLLTHNLVHKCEVCGKGFSRPWLLQGHMRSHTGEKPYSCSNCGKTFADRSNLRAHMQTHSPAKNYKCRNCQKSFALKSYLNKHYDSACFKDATTDSNSSE